VCISPPESSRSNGKATVCALTQEEEEEAQSLWPAGTMKKQTKRLKQETAKRRVKVRRQCFGREISAFIRTSKRGGLSRMVELLLGRFQMARICNLSLDAQTTKLGRV
jgi:hypothetical protein